MTGFFLCGLLGHPPLRAVIFGREVAVTRARLPEHELRPSMTGPFATLVAGGAGVDGVLAADLSADEVARLSYFHAATGQRTSEVTVAVTGGCPVTALACFVGANGTSGGIWDQTLMLARWAATVTSAAADIMAGFGKVEAEAAGQRLAQILTRAGARLRAGDLRPATGQLRRAAAPDDVVCNRLSQPYAAFFAVEERDLHYRRFDQSLSGAVNRAVFISGDAAVVLPYDPVRDRVMVIEQFRAGAHARGDANPWLLEAVAGRIDGGETPEEAALREAREEAGLAIRHLIAGPRYYPSPAAKSEYIYSFIGLADLPDEAAGLGGLASEAEDIRSHVIPFERLMELVLSGEVDAAPLTLIALWLERERPRLRAAV